MQPLNAAPALSGRGTLRRLASTSRPPAAVVVALLLTALMSSPVAAHVGSPVADGHVGHSHSSDAGIEAVFSDGVPSQVQRSVNEVLAEFERLLVFPEGSVQIAVDWKSQRTLGVGGPVVVQRDGVYFPAAVADAVFGGHHARGAVDGFVTMGSSHSWYFGAADAVPSGQFDFRSAFAHELVHALGFTVETRLNTAGQRVLSGRTALFDANLVSQGRRLIDLAPAAQSAALQRDDVWFDVGGGRLIPLNSRSGVGVSHFGHASSPVDAAPGALMYEGLSRGVRHQIDGPVLGALARLGFTTAVSPQAPRDVAIDGGTLRWHTDLAATAPPPETIRVETLQAGRVTSSVDLPGAVSQHLVPIGLRSHDLRVTAIDRSGRTASTLVSAGPVSIADATSLNELISAPDYKAEYGNVLRLYWAFFNREPDVGGARYWIGLYRSGTTLDSIARAFAGSTEFNHRYGALQSNADYLSVIYRNVLGRERDQSGFLYWLGLLDTGRLDRGAVVRWIAAAPEFVAAHPY